MPGNQAQRMFFAFVTVLITVHAYVFYSLYVINGDTFIQYASMAEGTQVSSVFKSINILGGVEVLGIRMPVWGVVLIETTGAGDTFMACVLNAVIENGLDNMDYTKLYKMLEFEEMDII